MESQMQSLLPWGSQPGRETDPQTDDYKGDAQGRGWAGLGWGTADSCGSPEEGAREPGVPGY